MTPQCTDCLGYHGQAKPCPAFGTTKDAAATGVTLAQWQDVCYRHNTLFLENESLRSRLASVEAERDAALQNPEGVWRGRWAQEAMNAGELRRELNEVRVNGEVASKHWMVRAEQAEALQTDTSIRLGLEHGKLVDAESALAEAEAREKAEDERIRELEGAIAKAIKGCDCINDGTPGYCAVCEGLQSVTSPSQPVKVAEECVKAEFGQCVTHPGFGEACPPAEKLTGTGECDGNHAGPSCGSQCWNDEPAPKGEPSRFAPCPDCVHKDEAEPECEKCDGRGVVPAPQPDRDGGVR